MDDLAILVAAAGLVVLPGVAGYVLAGWRTRGSRRWNPWVGWAVPTLCAVAFWATCWLWALEMQRQRGTDDGSVPMALTVLVATVLLNAATLVVLIVRSRRTHRLVRMGHGKGPTVTNVSNGRPVAVAAGVLGLLTLLPVFLLLATAMVLSNIAHAEKSSQPGGALEEAWRAFTILGAPIYGVLYVLCGWRGGPGWRRCRAYLAVFSACTALMLAFMASGNFLHQTSRWGILHALGNHLTEVGYVVVLMAYGAVLVRGLVPAGRPSSG